MVRAILASALKRISCCASGDAIHVTSVPPPKPQFYNLYYFNRTQISPIHGGGDQR
jgi:hypothetical protein